MAQLLETIRNNILTSIYGRRLGLDQADYLGGFKAHRGVVQDIQSTTPNTAVLPYGHTRNLTSGSSQGPVQHTLDYPVPGVMKTLSLDSTSTGSQQYLVPAGVSIKAASDGTTKAVINFVGQGGSAVLIGETTDIYRVLAQASTGGVTYTTST